MKQPKARDYSNNLHKTMRQSSQNADANIKRHLANLERIEKEKVENDLEKAKDNLEKVKQEELSLEEKQNLDSE